MEREKEKLIEVRHKDKKALVIEDKDNFFVIEGEYSPILHQAIKRLTGKTFKEGERVNKYLVKIKKGG